MDEHANVRVQPPQRHGELGKTRAEASKLKSEKQHAQMAKPNATRIEDQFQFVMNRIKTVPRQTDSEQRLWEAIEKLNDLHGLQHAQNTLLSKSEGRFSHRNDSKEARRIEEKVTSFRRSEAMELTKRKQELERLIDNHSALMTGIRNQLLEEQSAHKETAEMLQDEQLQRKHAMDNYKEVQGWLDESRKKVKDLDEQLREFQLAKQTLDDQTRDMETKITNLQQDVDVREERLKHESNKTTRLQSELDAFEGILAEHKDDAKRVKNQMGADETERNAEIARLAAEIQHLTADIEVITERTKRWEKFDELCPDFKELVAQLEAKDEVLHRAKQTVTIKHSDVQTLVRREQQQDAEIRKRLNQLVEIEDILDSIVTPTDISTGKVCVERTLVCCYPDPCPVGRELHLVVTTCDSTGQPIRGVHKAEFSVQEIVMPTAGGLTVGSDHSISDVLDNEKSSSTFHCSYTTTCEGRSGFKVTFRGHTFFASANVPAASPSQQDALDVEGSRIPRFTVHCSPNSVALGETMDVAIVVREVDSLLPARDWVASAEQFMLAPYTTAQGLRIENPLRQVPGAPVYTVSVPVGGITAQGSARDYIGVEVMLQGGTDASRGSSKLVADARHETEWDPTTTTVTCSPDPACVGDEVTVLVTPRNNYWVPLSADCPWAPTPSFSAMGSSTHIQQPVRYNGVSQAYVGKVVPAAAGRCGVSVSMGGLEIGSASVSVKAPEKADPSKTILKVEPSVVSAGECIHVTMITCDSTGRYAPGPEPTAFRLSPLSASSVLMPLRRVEGVDFKYVTTIQTATNSSYTTAGLSVDFDGVTMVKKVRVAGEGLDVPREDKPAEAEKPNVPKYTVTFGADPIAPSSVVPIKICINQDDPAMDRRRRGGLPVVTPVLNSEVVSAVTSMAGSRQVWECLVRVGDMLGSSAVEVDIDGSRFTASTTVEGDTVGDFDDQVARLKEIEIRIRDLMRRTEEVERDQEERAKLLDEREAAIQLKEEELAHANEPEEETPQHLLFGMQLSDGVQYGAQWEPIDGAKLAGIVEGGPLSMADSRIAPGDILKEVQYEDRYGYIHICAVRQMDDFRRISRMLSRQGGTPIVTLTFLTSANKLIRVAMNPATTPDPPGRPMGTRRHPSKSIEYSFCSSAYGTSPARSR